MDYKTEELSPVEKKITVTVPPQEVDAAIAASVALLGKSVQLDGFRKGKAPAKMVEKHFHDRIYNEAREDLISAQINDVLQNLDVAPVAGIDIKGADKPLEKGQEYVYTMQFETLPQFDLPNYEGMEAEEEKAEVNEEELKKVFDRFVRRNAKITPVEGIAPPKDGQIANIDFDAFENGEPIADLKTVNFDLELGANHALPEFEAIVKGIPVGNTGEGEVHFPDDFIDEKIAGKTLTMKVRVNAVKELKLPVPDDEFAKKVGYQSLADMNEKLRANYLKTIKDINKSVTQKKLLDQLLKMTDFPLPSKLVQMQSRLILTDMAARMERQGKSISSLGKTLDELLEEVRPQAEAMARNQVLLLSIAKKENLDVPQEQVNMSIFYDCLRNGDDFQQTLESMRRNGMIYEYRDRMIADKAMDLVYERANIKMVEPAAASGDEGGTVPPASDAAATDGAAQ